MTTLFGLLGLTILLVVASEAFEVMLLPRRIRRQLRPVRFIFQWSWSVWSHIARLIRKSGMRDGFLSAYGPLSMVLLLTYWVAGLVVSFGLLHWAAHGRADLRLLGDDLYLSGVTFFTVGYGDVLPHNSVDKAVSVLEAGVGLAFIAVTIGYLPVLYQLFSRRESRVIQLDARAGSPPCATTLLCRHNDFSAIPELEGLLKDWEQWCAELVESHLSYPMLSYYRSQHDNQSWLASLTALVDTCALMLTGLRGVPTFQARITFAMGRAAFVELCRIFRLRIAKRPADRISDETWAGIEERLSESGLFFAEPDGARELLGAFRSTYEPYATALSKYFLLPLPPWTAAEQAIDNWQRSRGGSVAKELVERAPGHPQ